MDTKQNAEQSAKGSAHVHVVCPHCDTTNRVSRERVGAGPKCGSCKRTLLLPVPFELSGENYERHVSATDLPLIVDFWAAWCGPCQMMAPAYEQAAARLAPGIRLAKLDTEKNPDIAGRMNIRGIPTLIAFKDGREVARQSGAMNLSGLLGWINSNVGEPAPGENSRDER